MDTRWLSLWALLSTLTLLLILASCSAPSTPVTPVATLALPTRPMAERAQYYPKTRPSIERGRQVYSGNCDACHGARGGGDGPQALFMRPRPTDFTDEVRRRDRSPERYYQAVAKGVLGTAMLSWDKVLSEEQMWDVVFYTWSLADTPERLALGRQVYRAQCARCHGADGDGRGPDVAEDMPAVPAFTDARWLVVRTPRQLYEAISGTGLPGLSDHTWAEKLSDEERWAVVSYLWTFLLEPSAGAEK